MCFEKEFESKRDASIRTIASLYPADSPYEMAAAKGKRLLLDAVAFYWRALPSEILYHYAKLCELEHAHEDCRRRTIENSP